MEIHNYVNETIFWNLSKENANSHTNKWKNQIPWEISQNDGWERLKCNLIRSLLFKIKKEGNQNGMHSTSDMLKKSKGACEFCTSVKF